MGDIANLSRLDQIPKHIKDRPGWASPTVYPALMGYDENPV
jgi:hypothetical protein